MSDGLCVAIIATAAEPPILESSPRITGGKYERAASGEAALFRVRHKTANLGGTPCVSCRQQAFAAFDCLWNRRGRDLFKHSLDGADDRLGHRI